MTIDPDQPHVVGPGVLIDRLIRFVDDTPTPDSILAQALRAALIECGDEQTVAVHGLGRRDVALSFRALCCGRLEMANRVVRSVGEVLKRLPRDEETDR